MCDVGNLTAVIVCHQNIGDSLGYLVLLRFGEDTLSDLKEGNIAACPSAHLKEADKDCKNENQRGDGVPLIMIHEIVPLGQKGGTNGSARNLIRATRAVLSRDVFLIHGIIGASWSGRAGHHG